MIIGVTGGVGAGKSTVLAILEKEEKAHLIICDDVARQLQSPGGPVYDAIVSGFGEDILTDGPGSEIDRAVLSRIVFSDEQKLKKLNSLTHPLVKEEVLHLINIYYSADPDIPIVVEAALLIEAGYRNILDELWCVVADDETRIARLAESRGYERKRALNMMASQKSNEEFVKECDFAVYNSGPLEETRSQIRQRMEYLKKEFNL